MDVNVCSVNSLMSCLNNKNKKYVKKKRRKNGTKWAHFGF